MAFELWDNQKPAFEFAKDKDEVALLCEQRTGKTFLTIALLRYRMDTTADEAFCGLIVCKLVNKESTWLKYLNEHIPDLNVATSWDEFKKLKAPRLLLMHYQDITKHIKWLCKYKKFNWACVDEAHHIGSRGSKQSRAMARMSWIPTKIILTGTPMDKKPTDMFGQMRFLKPDVFGCNWAEFEEEYLVFDTIEIDDDIPKGSPAWQQLMLKQRILRSRATFNEDKWDQFTKLIEPFSIRLEKADVGIAPTLVKKVPVLMTKRQRRYYDKMMKTSIIRFVGGAQAIAQFKAVNIMKQRQIASGFVYDDEDNIHYVTGGKDSKLLELVDRLPRPTVIFTAFRPDLARIEETLNGMGYRVGVLHGGVKKKLRPQLLEDFQNAQYDFLICQTKTGGVGIDLWKASNAIVYSMGHSFIDWDQMKSRMDKRGHQARVYVLCCENSVDDDLFDLVIVKALSGERVLKQLKLRR